MNWWNRLKEHILRPRGSTVAPSEGTRAARVHTRFPSSILALCTHDEMAFNIEIVSLSLSGLRLVSRQAINKGACLVVRVPVGLNFENRDTQEYVTFSLESVWVRRVSRGTWEAGGRYLERRNEKRDHWMELILESYGLSLSDDSRRQSKRFTAILPVSLEGLEGAPSRSGHTLNISTGGLLAAVGHGGYEDGAPVRVMLGPIPNADVAALQAHIVHCHFEESAAAWYLGVRFDEVDEEKRNQLMRLVSVLAERVRADLEETASQSA